jgi:hypothetical protein
MLSNKRFCVFFSLSPLYVPFVSLGLSKKMNFATDKHIFAMDTDRREKKEGEKEKNRQGKKST